MRFARLGGSAAEYFVADILHPAQPIERTPLPLLKNAADIGPEDRNAKKNEPSEERHEKYHGGPSGHSRSKNVMRVE